MSGKTHMDIDHLKKLNADGVHPKEIGRILGYSQGTVETRLIQLGLSWDKKPGGAPKTKESTEEEIIEKYKEGLGATTLGKMFHVDKGTIYNILKRHGVGTRSVASRRNDNKVSKKPRISERDIRMGEYYSQGLSIVDIAKKENIHESSVRDSLRKQQLFTADGGDLKMRQKPSYTKKLIDRRKNRDIELRHDAFDILDEHAAYWTGFLLADGHICRVPRKSARVMCQLALRDKSHLEKLKAWLHSSCTVIEGEHESFGKMHKHARLQVTSDVMANRLCELGIVEAKEGRYVLPSLTMSRHFWRGCIDGDGSVYTQGKIYLSGQLGIVEEWQGFCHDYLKRNDAVSIAIQPQHGRCYVGTVTSREGMGRAIIKLLYQDASVFLDRKMRIAGRMA